MLMCRIFDPGHLEGVLAKGVYISHISHISLLIAKTLLKQQIMIFKIEISLFYNLSEPKQWK